MKKIIGISRNGIKRNNDKRQNNQPVVKVHYEDGIDVGHEVVIMGQDGKEAARVIYNREQPQKGMNAWIETDNDIEIIR